MRNKRDIFSDVSAHQIQGIMLHSSWSDYFAFLGLDGFKCLHEYRYMEESENMRMIRRYFIEHYNELPIDTRIDSDISPYVPYSNETRFAISSSTKQMHTQISLEGWVKWERESKQMFEQAYKELSDMGEIAGSNAVEKLVNETDKELCCAEQLLLQMKMTDFDTNVIVLEQERVKRKYCKLIEEFRMKGVTYER